MSLSSSCQVFLLGIWRGSSATIINDNFYSLTPFEFNFFFILRKSIKKILPNIFRKFNRNNVVMINVHGKCDTFEIANGIVNPIEYINHCSRLSFPLKWMKNSKIFFFCSQSHRNSCTNTYTHKKTSHISIQWIHLIWIWCVWWRAHFLFLWCSQFFAYAPSVLFWFGLCSDHLTHSHRKHWSRAKPIDGSQFHFYVIHSDWS